MSLRIPCSLIQICRHRHLYMICHSTKRSIYWNRSEKYTFQSCLRSMETATPSVTTTLAHGSRQQRIVQILQAATETLGNISILDVQDESRNHSRGKETHYKVLIVAEKLAGISVVQRHRLINMLLESEFKNGLYSLSIKAKTPEEWAKNPMVEQSPTCRGGSKHDKLA